MIPGFFIHPSVILWLSVLYYLTPEVVFPFLLASCIHELGHYIVLCKLNKRPLSMTITFSGAVMETPPLSYKEELFAALGGPVVSLLCIAWIPIFPGFSLYSIILGLVNLIPIPGLDGEKALRGLLCLILSPEKSDTLCAIVSVFAALLMFLVSTALSRQQNLGWWPVAITAIFLLRSLYNALPHAKNMV